MKKLLKECFILLPIFFIFFLLVDFFVSSFFIKSSKNIYNEKDYGFYELSKSFKGHELFGSTIYKVFTDTAYIMDNTIRIKLGNSGGTPSDNPFGRRYFTDLKFEKVAFNAELDNYLNKFKLETSQ